MDNKLSSIFEHSQMNKMPRKTHKNRKNWWKLN